MTDTITQGTSGRTRATPEELAARGRAARASAPRSSHAEFAPPQSRFDPVALLEEQSSRRLPELIPIRYGRMTESPFRFYRGAAAIMAADLAGTARTGLNAQLCGDAHMLNFRLLGSPERHLMFDINDFDETLPGPWEWDVKRLATSLVIAGRENEFSDGDRKAVVLAMLKSYRESMRTFAGMRNLDVWYAQADADRIQSLYASQIDARARRKLGKFLTKARSQTNVQAFEKLTEIVKGSRRFASSPPLIVPIGDLLPGVERDALEAQLREILVRYSHTLQTDHRHLLGRFDLVDVARKVVGVGSVGTRCWIALLMGKDEEDPLILQIKEADRSVLEQYVGDSEYANQGQRVVAGQRLMQAASDIFLGWQRVEGLDGMTRDFYVRQLRDWKGIVEAGDFVPKGMAFFGDLCGWTLARAHARSGDRIGIAAYLGSGDAFDQAVAKFAESYADQNERDHQALVDAVKSGRVKAEATA